MSDSNLYDHSRFLSLEKSVLALIKENRKLKKQIKIANSSKDPVSNATENNLQLSSETQAKWISLNKVMTVTLHYLNQPHIGPLAKLKLISKINVDTGMNLIRQEDDKFVPSCIGQILQYRTPISTNIKTVADILDLEMQKLVAGYVEKLNPEIIKLIELNILSLIR